METTVQTLQISPIKTPKLDQPCSKCRSTAHFSCIEHCKAIFCTRCASQHHVIIIRQMRDLLKKLKIYRIDSASFLQKSTSLTVEKIDPQQAYISLLEEHLKRDRLIEVKILTELEMYLSDRTTRIVRSTCTPTISRSFSTRGRLLRRPQIRPQTASLTWTKTVTASLTIQKRFQISQEPSCSLNEYPIAVSLNGHYSEAFFCRWEDNSVILLSRGAIDIYTRASGLTYSIPLHHALGSTKEKIYVGAWSAYLHRLVLVGRYYFYIYDLDRQKVRSLCECGCGGSCGQISIPPKPDWYTRLRFRCPPIYDDFPNSTRFLACSLHEHLFYAYRLDKSTYRLEVYSLTQLFDIMDEEQEPQSPTSVSGQTVNDIKIKPLSALVITGQVAAICATHDRLAIVYRRLRPAEKSTKSWLNSSRFDHYFALFDHSLTKLTEEVLLLPSIQWITAVVAFGTEYEYLLCDPLGQQLLLFQATTGVVINRFHLSCVHACCLNDGRLVLWIRQSYANSPIGKLHFISAPHLEKYRMETKLTHTTSESHA